jgi:hypothetical protein
VIPIRYAFVNVPALFFEFFLSDTHYSREMLNISTTKSYRRRDVTLSYSHPSIHFDIYSFLLICIPFELVVVMYLNAARFTLARINRPLCVELFSPVQHSYISKHNNSRQLWNILSGYSTHHPRIPKRLRAPIIALQNSFLSFSRKRTKKFKFIQIKKKNWTAKMDHFSGIPSHGTCIIFHVYSGALK